MGVSYPLPHTPTYVSPYSDTPLRLCVYTDTVFSLNLRKNSGKKFLTFHKYPPPYIFNVVLKKKFRKKFSGNFETSLCYKFIIFSNRQKLVSRLFTLFFKPINSILNVYATYINLIISPHLL